MELRAFIVETRTLDTPFWQEKIFNIFINNHRFPSFMGRYKPLPLEMDRRFTLDLEEYLLDLYGEGPEREREPDWNAEQWIPPENYEPWRLNDNYKWL
tara:strand:+ start:51 stop:344 length:294 start_codon:yes stop_codon:yes gene_type:complete